MITLTLGRFAHLKPWQLAAVPSAYDEATKAQMLGMPGVRWCRDEMSPNGRGYFVGAHEAIEAIASVLVVARVVKLNDIRTLESELAHDGATFDYWNSAASSIEWLRPYQQVGAGWLAAMGSSSGGALLADEMGIGKTHQAIGAADLLWVTRVAVIAPAIMGKPWRERINGFGDPRWALSSRVMSYEIAQAAMTGGRVKKPKTKFEKAFVEAGNILWGVEPLAPPQLLIIDEGHAYSNPKAKRTKDLMAWLSSLPTRPIVIMLTGTPMTAELVDLWAPLTLIHPGRWGTWFQFAKRYAGGRFEEIEHVDRPVFKAEGRTNIPELKQRLQAVMLRRTKTDVKLELPPRTRTMVPIVLPVKIRNSLAKATQLLQWGGDPHTWKASVGSLLSSVESFKVDAAVELAEEVLAAGGKPLILTLRKATAEEIGNRLLCPVGTGDVVNSKRQALLSSALGAAAATLDAVTVGIDLVGFDTIIFTGLDWIPSKILQGEARLHRIGQLRPVTFYYLIGEGTIDEVVRERVLERLDTFAAAVGGDSSNLGSDLDDDSEDLISDLVKAIKEAA